MGEFETSNLPWSHIHFWLENEKILMLCKTSVTFFCIPKFQLGETNTATLKKYLAAAGIRKGF